MGHGFPYIPYFPFLFLTPLLRIDAGSYVKTENCWGWETAVIREHWGKLFPPLMAMGGGARFDQPPLACVLVYVGPAAFGTSCFWCQMELVGNRNTEGSVPVSSAYMQVVG